jgi:hypothetical protein
MSHDIYTAKSDRSGGIVKAIVITGLITGTLDAIAPMVVNMVGPLPLFRFIASGAFGRDAFAGGLLMAFWGLLFHYFIAFTWTTLFYLAYPRIPVLSKNKYAVGVAYGIVIWLVMNLVVLPMSNVPGMGPKTIWSVMKGASILILMVGLPISILANRFYAGKS